MDVAAEDGGAFGVGVRGPGGRRVRACQVHPGFGGGLLDRERDAFEGAGVQWALQVGHEGVVDERRDDEAQVGAGLGQGGLEDGGLQEAGRLDDDLAVDALGVGRYRADVQGDAELDADGGARAVVVPAEREGQVPGERVDQGRGRDAGRDDDEGAVAAVLAVEVRGRTPDASSAWSRTV